MGALLASFLVFSAAVVVSRFRVLTGAFGGGVVSQFPLLTGVVCNGSCVTASCFDWCRRWLVGCCRVLAKDGSIREVLDVVVGANEKETIVYPKLDEVAAILPNYNDHAFIRVHLTEKDLSLRIFQNSEDFPKL